MIELLTWFQFKESVRQFAQENIAPHAAAIDARNSFPEVGTSLQFPSSSISYSSDVSKVFPCLWNKEFYILRLLCW